MPPVIALIIGIALAAFVDSAGSNVRPPANGELSDAANDSPKLATGAVSKTRRMRKKRITDIEKRIADIESRAPIPATTPEPTPEGNTPDPATPEDGEPNV